MNLLKWLLPSIFVTDFQEFKLSTAERIDKIKLLLWENVTGHDIVRAEYI